MSKWNFRKIHLSLLLLLLFLAMAAFFRWLPLHYDVTPDNSPKGDIGGGSGCPGNDHPGGPYLKIVLYDRRGMPQGFGTTSSTYMGDAPLYEPNTADTALSALSPCEYPPLPPDIVKEWPQVYPLLIETQPPEISAGQSKNLEVTILVDTQYSGSGYGKIFPVVIKPGEKIPVSLVLNVVNFEFSPNAAPAHEIQIGKPITQSWIIAPKENVEGEQSINVEVQGLDIPSEEGTPSIKIELIVRPRDELPSALRSFLFGLGIHPSWMVALSIFGALLAGAKWILDLYKTWQDVREARGASKTKLPAKAKPKSGKSKPGH